MLLLLWCTFVSILQLFVVVVPQVIGVYAECVQRVAFKHILSEAAMLNIHLCAGVTLGFVMWGELFLKETIKWHFL